MKKNLNIKPPMDLAINYNWLKALKEGPYSEYILNK